MPQSAISTGVVDFILPLADVPATIIRYNQIKPRLPIVEDKPPSSHDERVLLQKIYAHLRARTERDFSRYKPSTVLRRIARRMQMNYIEDLAVYVERLRERPQEVRTLADDLLITITHFFRDPPVFDRLERGIIPQFFERKSGGESLRVWSVGCATGEEAYSLAILMIEAAERFDKRLAIQVFATDLHGTASPRLEKPLSGRYHHRCKEERLRRFFEHENGEYRIRKEVRDLVVFAPHNVLSDPPYSRMDVISCRNMMIYWNAMSSRILSTCSTIR